MGLTSLPDGTTKCDPYDLLGIVKDTSTGRFHVTLWLEHPMPGLDWANDSTEGPVRLKSKFHHTAGADTFEGAVEQLKELRKKLILDDVCVWDTQERCFEKNFQEGGFTSVLFLDNWRRGVGTPVPPVVTSRFDNTIESLG